MKKMLSILLAALMLLSVFSLLNVSAETVQSAPAGFETWNALFAHAVSGSDDGDAWVAWQSTHDESFSVRHPEIKYFFLPSSADSDRVDVYNAFSEAVTVNGTEIGAGETAAVSYEVDKDYKVETDGDVYTLRFMRSGAEAAIYVNNSNADGKGTDLMSYLNVDKSRSAKATGAIVTPDGKIDNTVIKKIKGRGNTTWQKAKKAYNITYDSKVSIAGMKKSKKYSILANYQDDSLSRNRFLYDLSDAVGMPYASDSRYVDFYVNGFYWGSYQMAEKVEAGSSSLVSDFEEEDYLTEDGQGVKEDFPFVAEVDANPSDDDYRVTISNGINITIKTPELEPGDVGYEEVKKYVKDKFTAFYNATATETEGLAKYADIDSLAKLYLINELGKNWDSGASSTFFTYKTDENGTYKFYGSPVWDYDNSLGNAVGVWDDLRNMGVDDYEEYTGWWCRYKGKSSGQRDSANIVNRLSVNETVYDAAVKIWNEKFIPAINHFAGTDVNAEIGEELYTADEYYNLIKDSAEMNYTSGWLLNTGGWIADHTKLNKATYDAENNTYSVSGIVTRYENNFEGMYNYCRDWMISRAAWLSKEMAGDAPVITPSETHRVYFDNSSYNWEEIYIYIYTDRGTQNNGWPGDKMQYDSELELYYYDVPEDLSDGYAMFAESGDLVGNRYPGDQQPGLPIDGKNMILKADYEWVEYVPEATTEPEEPGVVWYITGDFFGDSDTSNKLVAGDEQNIVTATLELEAGEYLFKINSSEGICLGNSGSFTDTTETTSPGIGWTFRTGVGNCTLQASGGTYTFNFNTDTNRLIVLYEPKSDETEPTTESSDPTTESSEPTTESVEPTTDSSAPTTEPTTAMLTDPDYYVYGDANFDRVINVKDVTTIQKYLASLGTLGGHFGRILADVDNSGDVNIKDATYIQIYLAKLSGSANVGKEL